MLLKGFEPWTINVGSDRFTNRATTTAFLDTLFGSDSQHPLGSHPIIRTWSFQTFPPTLPELSSSAELLIKNILEDNSRESNPVSFSSNKEEDSQKIFWLQNVEIFVACFDHLSLTLAGGAIGRSKPLRQVKKII